MKRLGMFAALALIASCAHAPPEPEDVSSFTLNSNRSAYTATLTPSQVTGAQFQVSRFPGGFRGTVFGAPVDLRVQPEAVTGSVGAAPVSLHLDRIGQQNQITRIQGLYGGHLSDLQVSTDGIQGKIGRCSYSLTQQAGVYSGQSVCGGAKEQPTVVDVPAELLDAPSAARAAELVMLLGQ